MTINMSRNDLKTLYQKPISNSVHYRNTIVKLNKVFNAINFDDINNFDFSKGFIEVLDNPLYVHPYFDFDIHKSENEDDDFNTIIDIYSSLETLETLFGEYSYGAYTNNKDIANAFDIDYIEDADKFFSLHVYYYNVQIKSKYLIKLMSKDKDNQFISKNIPKYADEAVYKLNGIQTFRHPLSNKIYTYHNAKNKYNACKTLHESNSNIQPLASHCLITVNGTERIITENELDEFFDINVFNKILKQTNKDNLEYEHYLLYQHEFSDYLQTLSEKEQYEFTNKIYELRNNNTYIKEFNKLVTEYSTQYDMTEDEYINELLPSDYILLYDLIYKQLHYNPLDIKYIKAIKKSLKNKHKLTDDEVLELTDNKNLNIHDINYNELPLDITSDDIYELLINSTIEAHYNELVTKLKPLYHANLDIKIIIEAVNKWYNKFEHKSIDNVTAIVNRYYHKSNTNEWIYKLSQYCSNQSIIDNLLTKCPSSHINFNITINNSDKSIQDIIETNYDNDSFATLINDLRCCIGLVNNVWYIKYKNENQYQLIMKSRRQLDDWLGMIHPYKSARQITLNKIIIKYAEFFNYHAIDFYKVTPYNCINKFLGFNIKANQNQIYDYSILDKFLTHIKTIICNNSNKAYTMFMRWVANIFQNIAVKNGTILIIYGSQGSGKTCVMNVFSELLGYYSYGNATDIDSIIGKFNSLLDDKLLAIINETPDADTRYNALDKIKALITETKTKIERKGIDAIECKNYCNYIITTNYSNPLRDSVGNRRFIYLQTNNTKTFDNEYFNELFSTFMNKDNTYNQTFMMTLLNYLQTQIEIPLGYRFESYINECINESLENNVESEYLDNQYMSLNQIDKFIIDKYNMFSNGVTYQHLCSIDLPVSIDKFCKGVSKLCTVSKKYDKSTHSHYKFYILKPEKDIKEFYKIIKYRQTDEQTL